MHTSCMWKNTAENNCYPVSKIFHTNNCYLYRLETYVTFNIKPNKLQRLNNFIYFVKIDSFGVKLKQRLQPNGHLKIHIVRVVFVWKAYWLIHMNLPKLSIAVQIQKWYRKSVAAFGNANQLQRTLEKHQNIDISIFTLKINFTVF